MALWLCEHGVPNTRRDLKNHKTLNPHSMRWVFVCRGDTLTAIAKQYDATVERIAVLNNISDADLLQTGQELVIPVLSQELTHNKVSMSNL